MTVSTVHTATDIIVISKELWRTIWNPVLKPSTVYAKTASWNILLIEGEFLCDVSIGAITRNTDQGNRKADVPDILAK